MKKTFFLKNMHLLISSVVVPIAGVCYGFYPNLVFEINVNTIDQHNILKAIMGMYFAFAALWILGIFNTNYWKTASISNILFMFGLGFGRISSLVFDGNPSNILFFGTFGELVLGFYGIYVLKSFHSK